jgi:hypothetical protein
VDVEPTSLIVSSYFNTQPYELFEVLLDMAELEGLHQFKIEYGIDENNIVDKYVSECFEVNNEIEANHLITYASDQNNDLIFSTGFYGKIRLEYDTTGDFIPSNELDNFQTDTKLITLENRLLPTYEFRYYDLSELKAVGLSQMLLCNIIFIDGVEFTNSGTPEIKRIHRSTEFREATYSLTVVLQKQDVHGYLTEAYNPQAINNGGSFAFGTFITSGGILVNSNGLIIND